MTAMIRKHEFRRYPRPSCKWCGLDKVLWDEADCCLRIDLRNVVPIESLAPEKQRKMMTTSHETAEDGIYCGHCGLSIERWDERYCKLRDKPEQKDIMPRLSVNETRALVGQQCRQPVNGVPPSLDRMVLAAAIDIAASLRYFAQELAHDTAEREQAEVDQR